MMDKQDKKISTVYTYHDTETVCEVVHTKSHSGHKKPTWKDRSIPQSKEDDLCQVLEKAYNYEMNMLN
jgi:hypothetical protein